MKRNYTRYKFRWMWVWSFLVLGSQILAMESEALLQEEDSKVCVIVTEDDFDVLKEFLDPSSQKIYQE